MSDEIVLGAAADLKPVPPSKPALIECCGAGCTPCVYDVYWENVARYEAALEAWQARHRKKTCMMEHDLSIRDAITEKISCGLT